jgi:hypothetical protein
MDASLHKRAEQLATEFASQARTAEDLNGLRRLMMKSALERMLNTELDVHLGRRSPSQGILARRIVGHFSEVVAFPTNLFGPAAALMWKKGDSGGSPIAALRFDRGALVGLRALERLLELLGTASPADQSRWRA